MGCFDDDTFTRSSLTPLRCDQNSLYVTPTHSHMHLPSHTQTASSTGFCAPLCYSFVAFLHIDRLFQGFFAKSPSPRQTGPPRARTPLATPPPAWRWKFFCALAIYTFFLQQRRSHHEVSLEDSALPHLPLHVIPVCPVCSSSHGYVHAIPPCGHIVDTWEVPPPVRVNVSPIEVQPPVRVNVSPIEVQPPVRVNLSSLESRERQVGLRDPSVDHCMRDAGLFPAEFNVRTSMTGLLRSTVCFIVILVQRSVTCSGSHACGPGTDAVRFIAPVRTESPCIFELVTKADL
ncbi:hypothetical protein Bbelb_308810 [Branchiostoma belcheri]|nr:hypothetical protein Bbelb_308810 [Branchiostoma belcheri]